MNMSLLPRLCISQNLGEVSPYPEPTAYELGDGGSTNAVQPPVDGGCQGLRNSLPTRARPFFVKVDLAHAYRSL